jgi:hypothetical protein
MDTTKAEAIIARFTSDPKIKAQVLANIADFKAGKTSVDQIIAANTSDPALAAWIKTFIGKIQAGHQVHTLTSFGTPDSNQALGAAETANMHRGAIAAIVNS